MAFLWTHDTAQVGNWKVRSQNGAETADKPNVSCELEMCLVSPPKDKRQIVILITGTAAIWQGVAIWTMPWPVLLGLFVAILLLILLARILSAIDHRKYQRLADRKCLNCGYDLRESTERCPECGAIFWIGVGRDVGGIGGCGVEWLAAFAQLGRLVGKSPSR